MFLGGNDPESFNQNRPSLKSSDESFGFRRRSSVSRKQPAQPVNTLPETRFNENFGTNFQSEFNSDFHLEPKSVTEKVPKNFDTFDNYEESSFTSQRRSDVVSEEPSYQEDEDSYQENESPDTEFYDASNEDSQIICHK